MGSAFTRDGLQTPEMVLFAYGDISDDPTVLHQPHAECAVECPHAMSVCGRFQKVGYHGNLPRCEASGSTRSEAP